MKPKLVVVEKKVGGVVKMVEYLGGRGGGSGTCQLHLMLELDQQSAPRVRLKCLVRSIRCAYFVRSQNSRATFVSRHFLVLVQRPRREAPGGRFQMFTAFHRIRPNHGSCGPHHRKRAHGYQDVGRTLHTMSVGPPSGLRCFACEGRAI